MKTPEFFESVYTSILKKSQEEPESVPILENFSDYRLNKVVKLKIGNTSWLMGLARDDGLSNLRETQRIFLNQLDAKRGLYNSNVAILEDDKFLHLNHGTCVLDYRRTKPRWSDYRYLLRSTFEDNKGTSISERLSKIPSDVFLKKQETLGQGIGVPLYSGGFDFKEEAVDVFADAIFEGLSSYVPAVKQN